MSAHHKRRFPAMPCIDLALSESVIRNNMADIRRALQAGAFVNGLDREGLGAIHHAIYENNFDALRLLVRHGADVRLRDSEGWTPLHTVAQTGNCEMASFLVKEGANTDAVDGDGLFPIDRAERSDMRSLLYRAMKRAGHVQLSNQYRTYLEQELVLEGWLGDTDSLCSSVSAYSFSLSEDEGQFSQSDGDELHGILMQGDEEEGADTLSLCATTTQLVRAGEQEASETLGDKTEPRNGCVELSLRSRNDREEVAEDREAAFFLVKVRALECAPGLKFLECTVEKDLVFTPEVNVVYLGEHPANNEVLCNNGKLRTDGNEEGAEMLGVQSVGEVETVADMEYAGDVQQQEGTPVCSYKLLSDARQETPAALNLSSVTVGGSHLVNQQLGAATQVVPYETVCDSSTERKSTPPEVALSRSELKNARAAFFSSPQPRRRRTPVKNKCRSTSPSSRRRVQSQSVPTAVFTRLAREESPRDSSSCSSLILEEETVEEKDTGMIEGVEHSRSRLLDFEVGMSHCVDTTSLKSVDIAHQGLKENGDAEQTTDCNTQLMFIPQCGKNFQEEANMPVMDTDVKQTDVEVMLHTGNEGNQNEIFASQLEATRSNSGLHLEVCQDAGEHFQEVNLNSLKEREGSNDVSSIAQENGTQHTMQSSPQKTVQSFGWESCSDDDSCCEETVVFFRVDEFGTCVRNESDVSSGNSLFSPDSDPPPMPSHLSADHVELPSRSSDSSCDSACEEKNPDKFLLADLSRRSKPCSSSVAASVEQENGCLFLLSNMQQEDVGDPMSESDDDGCHTVQNLSRIRTSPPRPRSLRCNVDSSVTLRHPQHLKSSMKQSSLPNLNVCSKSKPPAYRRSVTFEPVVCFQDAVVGGNIEEVQSLINAKSVDLDEMTPQGYAVLHAAAIEGNINCIRMLVGSGANVNIQDEDGWTPLHAAASHGYLDIVQYLLRNGADACIVGNNHETAYEVVDDDSDPVLEQILKDAMGDQFEVLVASKQCQDADEYSEDGDDEESDEEEVLSFQDDGDESAVGTVFLTSRLTHAADIGKWSSHSSKSVATDQGDDLPVKTSCDSDNDAHAIAGLLHQGLDEEKCVETKPEQPVELAPSGPVMQMNGADNSESEKMEYQSRSSTRPHRGALVHPLRVSPTFEDVETTDALSSPKSVSFPPSVLLQQAVLDGDVGEVEKLLSLFTPEELQINTVLLPWGGSLLQQCVNTENLDIVKLMIEKGSADPAIQDADGWTPLHNAAAVGNCSIARYLISCGVKVSVLTAQGQFPSDVAANPEMISLLRNAMLGRFWGTSFKGSL